jgi:NADH-quinone oxidoreductase subunit L
MTVPVLVLAGLAAIGGLLDLPFRSLEFLTTWLHPVFHDVPEIEAPSFAQGVALSALSVVVGLVGIGIAIRVYRRGLSAPDEDPTVTRLGALGRLFGHAYYFDEMVSRAVGGPVRRIADWLSAVMDARIIDGAVNGTAGLVRWSAEGLRTLHSGRVRTYALWIFTGTAGLLLFLFLYAGR